MTDVFRFAALLLTACGSELPADPSPHQATGAPAFEAPIRGQIIPAATTPTVQPRLVVGYLPDAQDGACPPPAGAEDGGPRAGERPYGEDDTGGVGERPRSEGGGG